MKCGFSEERIALFVENDLSPAECSDVEAHLAECVQCAQFADELRESQSIFKSMRQEAVTPAALADVRERVLVGIDSNWTLRFQRLLFAGLRWRYALAGVALVAVVTSVVLRLSPPESGMSGANAISTGRGRQVKLSEPASHQARTGRSNSTNPPVVLSSAQPPLPSQKGKSTRHAVQRQKPPAVPPPAADSEPRQVVVKLLTDDPDIVIYWLFDEKNGGEE